MRRTTCVLLIGLASTWFACGEDGGGGGGGRGFMAQPSLAADAAPRRASDRKLIQTARIGVLVSDLDAARTKLDLLLAQSAGFASQSQLQGRRDRVYSTVLRVPEGKFGETIKAIKDLGRVVAESLETEDVTSEFVDTEARIRNLTRTEARLLDILEKVAGNLAEILPVESELNRVRGEIETLTARTKQIEELVALATVSVTLYEESLDVIEEPDDIWKPFRQLKRNAGALLKKSFGALVAVFAAIANFLIVILPWAVLLALILVVRPGWRRGLMGLFSRRPRPK